MEDSKALGPVAQGPVALSPAPPSAIEPEALGAMRNAAMLVATGTLDNKTIAEMVGVSPSTLSRWKKTREFVAATIEFQDQFEVKKIAQAITSRGLWAVSELEDLARTSLDEAVKARILMWMAEMSVGKPKQQIEVSDAPKSPVARLDEIEAALVEKRARLEQLKSGSLGGGKVVEGEFREAGTGESDPE